MPLHSNYHIDQQLSNDTETIHMNTYDQRINDISKIATSSRPKVEILRANSPTFKRLLAVRIKLEKYLNSISNTISTNQQSTHEISNLERQPTIHARMPSSLPSQKRIKSKTSLDSGPLDKITYEKTLSNNGDVKQKCSLEIWLPKPGSDDEDGTTGRTISPDPNIIEDKTPSLQSISSKSFRSSTNKFFRGTTTSNSGIKSLDDTFSKKSEPAVIPRVYHYEDYLGDQSEDRPRSGKSSKSDVNGINKYIKYQRARVNTRHQSSSTNHTDESIQSIPSKLPMTSKNLLANIKQTSSSYEIKGSIGSTNSSMISELMRKYSMIKRNHQELTQAKLQLERPYQDSKHNAHITKGILFIENTKKNLNFIFFLDQSLPSLNVSDTTSYTSSDHSIMSGKKLDDTSSPQPVEDHNNTNTKLNDHRSSHHKSSYLDTYSQTRLSSLINHLQYRQMSNSMPTTILPPVTRRRNGVPFRYFPHSQTLDVVFTVPIDDSNKSPSHLPARPDSPENVPNSSNSSKRINNGNEQVPSHLPKQALLPPAHTPRSEQQQQQLQTPQSLLHLVQYQNSQKSAQRYHHSPHSSPSSTPTPTTDVPTNKVLVHLKYSNGENTDRNCLIPK